MKRAGGRGSKEHREAKERKGSSSSSENSLKECVLTRRQILQGGEREGGWGGAIDKKSFCRQEGPCPRPFLDLQSHLNSQEATGPEPFLSSQLHGASEFPAQIALSS